MQRARVTRAGQPTSCPDVSPILSFPRTMAMIHIEQPLSIHFTNGRHVSPPTEATEVPHLQENAPP